MGRAASKQRSPVTGHKKKCPNGTVCSPPQGDAVGPWFQVLLVCSTRWYCPCAQLAPLARLHPLPSHSLGVMLEVSWRYSCSLPVRRLAAATPPGHLPPHCGSAQPPSTPAFLALSPPSQPETHKSHLTCPTLPGITGFAWKWLGESPWSDTGRCLWPRGGARVQDPRGKDRSIVPSCSLDLHHVLVLFSSRHPQALASALFSKNHQ